jgi:2,4-dienoyl-CoA reductase (NADPH2)
VPTIATSVPRAAFAWVTQKMKAELRGRRASPRRWSPATASTPPRWPSRCWPTGAPTWSPWPGRCWPTRVRDKAAAGRPTRSTPASPATRPAWTTCSRTKTSSCLVNPRACHETELVFRPTVASQKARGRGGRRPGRADRRHHWPSAAMLVSCSTPPPTSAASSTWPSRCRARKSSMTLRYFRRRVETTGVDLQLGTRVAAPTWRLRRGGGGHRRHPA